MVERTTTVGFINLDVTQEVADAATEVTVVEDYTGGGRIAGCTVLHARGEEPRAVALIDTDDGARALAISDAFEIVSGMQSDEWVGRTVQVVSGKLAI